MVNLMFWITERLLAPHTKPTKPPYLDAYELEKSGVSNSEPFVVEFEGDDDPQNPKNWPRWKKVTTTAMVAFLVFQV